MIRDRVVDGGRRAELQQATERWLAIRCCMAATSNNCVSRQLRQYARFHVGSQYRHQLFHADPHPGNYAFDDDGQVVIAP